MLNYQNKVIVITGSGRGIGAEYAKFFASRKAKLVLNDNSKENGVFIIETLAAQLRKEFNTEIATNTDSVEEGHKIIETAILKFKRIDVLINNAGILLDRTMAKITNQDFDKVVRIHLKGSFRCILAAWPYFRKQKFGRIINTGSSSGLFGNFGQVNYSAAKAGIHGMTMALAKEGTNYNIKVNTIAPIANTRMTQSVIPDEIIQAVPAAAIASFVALLAHDECPESGQIYEVGGGWAAKLRWQRTEGGNFPLNLTPEILVQNWDKIVDFGRKNDYPISGSDSIERMFENFEKQSLAKSQTEKKDSKIQPEEIYKLMKSFIEAGLAEKAVEKCDSIYQFEITDKKTGKSEFQFWVAVNKNEQKAGTGNRKDADATFTVSDEEFFDICMGKLNPQVAFTKRLMKITGNFKKASAFTPDLFPKPTKENFDKYLHMKPKL